MFTKGLLYYRLCKVLLGVIKLNRHEAFLSGAYSSDGKKRMCRKNCDAMEKAKTAIREAEIKTLKTCSRQMIFI